MLEVDERRPHQLSAPDRFKKELALSASGSDCTDVCPEAKPDVGQSRQSALPRKRLVGVRGFEPQIPASRRQLRNPKWLFLFGYLEAPVDLSAELSTTGAGLIPVTCRQIQGWFTKPAQPTNLAAPPSSR